jgi:hypothetical protein
MTVYHGSFITLDESTHIRYIGIVTVDQYNEVGNPPNIWVKVEIVSDKGTEAEMNLQVDDIQKMSNASLKGVERTIGNNFYYPVFRIGPAEDCGGTDTCIRPKPMAVLNGPQWQVRSGSLL